MAIFSGEVKIKVRFKDIQVAVGYGITTWMMVPGQERIVAKRLNEILSSAT